MIWYGMVHLYLYTIFLYVCVCVLELFYFLCFLSMHLLLLLLTALNATDHTDQSIHPSPCSLQYTEVESFLEEMINFFNTKLQKRQKLLLLQMETSS